MKKQLSLISELGIALLAAAIIELLKILLHLLLALRW